MKKTLLTYFTILCFVVSVTSQTTFSSKMNITNSTGEDPFAIVSGDLDNDTHNDILFCTSNLDASALVLDTIEWYKNDGAGVFTVQTLVSSTLKQVSGLQIVDLNNDGFNDIIATSYFQGKLVWFENDKAGGFNSESIISSTVAGANATYVGFIDSGTTLDVAVSAGTDNKVVWFSNNGSGVFGTEQNITTALTEPGDIDMVDFDNDGDLDIVVSTSEWANGVIELFYNDLFPGGSVAFTKDTNSVSTSGNTFLFDISFADVNDDTVTDILVSDLYGDVTWYTKAIDETFAQTIIPITFNSPNDPRPATVKAVDMNNNGNTDIVISNGATNGNDIIWFESTAPNTYFAETAIDATQAQVYGFTVDDFDGDGDKDIASMAFQSNALNWFSNNKIVLGIEDNSLNKIRIYPNPTTDKLYFKSSIAEDFNISVYDILGKKVLENTVNINKSLDVSQLNNGIYIVRFDDYNSTYKFVKE